ncbi:hypothetical protein EBR66_04855 [bacterium]|nr:hypothetical protein [bacterium]
MTGLLGKYNFFPPTERRIFWLALLIFLVGVVGLFAYRNSSRYIVSKLPETEKSTQGYLYTAVDTKTNSKYLVVSDTRVAEHTFNPDFYFTYQDVSHIWNPKSCAKMPSVIDIRGNVFMIDVVYEGGVLTKKFIMYDAISRQKTYFDISDRFVISDLFLENGVPFFFERRRDGVYKTLIETEKTYAPFASVLVKQHKVFSIATDDLITARRHESGDIVFTLFENKTNRVTYRFDADTNSLVPYMNISHKEHGDSGMEGRLLGNGEREYRNIRNELEYGLLKEKTGITLFQKKSSAYLYTINSY